MDYRKERLAREPAPPYVGEGPHVMWHFSEDPSLRRLEPRVPGTNPGSKPFVWAVDTGTRRRSGSPGTPRGGASGPCRQPHRRTANVSSARAGRIASM